MTDIVEWLRAYANRTTIIDTKRLDEAANEIERLREWNAEIALNAREFAAENERLRAALKDIASGKYSGIVLPSMPPQDPAVNRARAALEGK